VKKWLSHQHFCFPDLGGSTVPFFYAPQISPTFLHTQRLYSSTLPPAPWPCPEMSRKHTTLNKQALSLTAQWPSVSTPSACFVTLHPNKTCSQTLLSTLKPFLLKKQAQGTSATQVPKSTHLPTFFVLWAASNTTQNRTANCHAQVDSILSYSSSTRKPFPHCAQRLSAPYHAHLKVLSPLSQSMI
jgi:hypothetical protein